MADLKLSLDETQVKAVHDVIARETEQFTTDPKTAPTRVNELRLIEALLAAHIAD